MMTGKSFLRALATTATAAAFIISCAVLNARAQQTEPPTQIPSPPQTSTPTPTPSPSSASSASSTEPDLSITATVTARELRFDVVPNPTVEFTGTPRRETVWEADRENLPRPVQPGVTYRDIGIRLRITSVFADIERIVAEALGEVPMTDDAPTPVAPPQTTTPPQTTPPLASSDAAPTPATTTTNTRRRNARGGTRPR